jgi:hypothetical protein
VAKVKLDRTQAKHLLPAKAYYKGVIKSSDALADPAGQAALVAPPRPQVWEARKLLGQFSSGKQVRCSRRVAASKVNTVTCLVSVLTFCLNVALPETAAEG